MSSYCVFGMTCIFVIRSLRASDCWVAPGATRNGAQPASYSTILLGCRGKRKLLLYCWFIAILTSQRRVLLPVFPCQFAHRRQEKCSNRIKVLLLVSSSFCLSEYSDTPSHSRDSVRIVFDALSHWAATVTEVGACFRPKTISILMCLWLTFNVKILADSHGLDIVSLSFSIKLRTYS